MAHDEVRRVMGGGTTFQCLFCLFLGLLFCSGTIVEESENGSRTASSTTSLTMRVAASHKQMIGDDLKSLNKMTQLDVVTPTTTIPTINPTTPILNPSATPATPMTPLMTPPLTNPTSMIPSDGSFGQSWCIASPTASQTALQVALDYACGYGGADCSAIQQGGSCFNPNTDRDHASYAFNDYYNKNPVSTSCDFGGAAILTNTDPSTSTCQYPSTSTSSSILNTTNPTGSTVFGSEPPSSSIRASTSLRFLHLITLVYLAVSLL